MVRWLLLISLPLVLASWSNTTDNHQLSGSAGPVKVAGDDTLIVGDLVFADFLSPNNDGNNDTFVILNVENYPKNSIKIFNRWGEVVYLSSPYYNEWDGTSNQGGALMGNILTDGTYYFEFLDGKGHTANGKITLKR